MIKGIRIYVEGGGNGKDQKADFRKGFEGLLSSLKAMACDKRLEWDLVSCGGRDLSRAGTRCEVGLDAKQSWRNRIRSRAVRATSRVWASIGPLVCQREAGHTSPPR